MWNKPSRQTLNSLPKLYSTEEVPLKEKLIQLHFFIGNTDFFIIEYDGENTFWGFVILNGDMEMSEFGYVDFDELKSIKVNSWHEIDCDLHWKIRPANQVEKICIARSWHLPESVTGIEIECPACKRIIMADSGSSEVQCHNCKVIVLQQHISSTFSGGLQWHTHQN
jgi:LSD1 subclass zinc finger protein